MSPPHIPPFLSGAAPPAPAAAAAAAATRCQACLRETDRLRSASGTFLPGVSAPPWGLGAAASVFGEEPGLGAGVNGPGTREQGTACGQAAWVSREEAGEAARRAVRAGNDGTQLPPPSPKTGWPEGTPTPAWHRPSPRPRGGGPGTDVPARVRAQGGASRCGSCRARASVPARRQDLSGGLM